MKRESRLHRLFRRFFPEPEPERTSEGFVIQRDGNRVWVDRDEAVAYWLPKLRRMQRPGSMAMRSSERGEIHVMPRFGAAHQESSSCWCGPSIDPPTMDSTQYEKRVWVHRAAH